MLCSVRKLSNRTMVHLLQGDYDKHPKTWDEHLSYIQYTYNHHRVDNKF